MKIYTLHVPSIILSMLQSIFVTQDQNFTRLKTHSLTAHHACVAHRAARLKNKHQIPIYHIRMRLYVFQEFKVISNNQIKGILSISLEFVASTKSCLIKIAVA